MVRKLKEIFRERETLDSKVFFIVLLVGGLTTFASAIFTFVEDLGVGATLSTACCFFLLAGLFVLAFYFHHETICHPLLCVLLNFIFLPVTFFFCGGLKSGMILYYLTALYIIVPSISHRKIKTVVFLSSLAALCVSIFLSTHVIPQYVVKVSNASWYLDAIVSLILNAVCIFFVANLTVESYESERKVKEKLLDKLEVLSMKDELTGLYNRRELFDRLENDIVKAEDDRIYLMMFDIDNFKMVNDTYGHVFGDRVLEAVAKCMFENIREEKGELAARYGGEEFVCILRADDAKAAFERAEELRKGIYAIDYEEHQGLHISISVGLISCFGYRKVREMLKAADELLYQAKSSGKNKVIR